MPTHALLVSLTKREIQEPLMTFMTHLPARVPSGSKQHLVDTFGSYFEGVGMEEKKRILMHIY